MASNAHRLLRLRLEIADVEIPITRTLEIDASTPLERLHHVIQIAFGWSDRARHVFTDRRAAVQPWPGEYGMGYGSFGQQRVWEMDHECRNRGHISECEWTSSIAGVFDTITPSATPSAFGDDAPVLFYEYGIETRCRAYEYGERCFGSLSGACPGHGWIVAVSLLGAGPRPRSRSAHRTANVLHASGRAPLEEACSAAGYNTLREVLGDPQHPAHAEVAAWAKRRVGPWAVSETATLDPAECDADAVQSVIDEELGGSSFGDSAGGHLQRQMLATPRRLRLDLRSTLGRLEVPEPDDAAAERLTARLRGMLHTLVAAEPVSGADAESSDAPHAPDPADLAFARTLGLLRRNRVPMLTRAAEPLIDKPTALLQRCAQHYWQLDPGTGFAMYVAIGTAQGLAGEALDRLVAAACEAEQHAPGSRSGLDWCSSAQGFSFGQTEAEARHELRQQMLPLISYLENAGALAPTFEPYARNDIRAFASLVLAQ